MKSGFFQRLKSVVIIVKWNNAVSEYAF